MNWHVTAHHFRDFTVLEAKTRTFVYDADTAGVMLIVKELVCAHRPRSRSRVHAARRPEGGRGPAVARAPEPHLSNETVPVQ